MLNNNEDIVDVVDYKNLLTEVMNQAIDDYVKLQHPTTRTKKYLQEFYLTAFDFLFDEEFLLMNLDTGFKTKMAVQDLVGEILDTEKPSLKALRNYAVGQCKSYWEEKRLAVIDHVPETVCISGQTFNICHAAIKGYAIDWETKTITLDKQAGQANEINMMEAFLSIILWNINGNNIKPAIKKTMAKELHWLLKVNNCFSNVGVPESSELFVEQTARG